MKLLNNPESQVLIMEVLKPLVPDLLRHAEQVLGKALERIAIDKPELFRRIAEPQNQNSQIEATSAEPLIDADKPETSTITGFSELDEAISYLVKTDRRITDRYNDDYLLGILFEVISNVKHYREYKARGEMSVSNEMVHLAEQRLNSTLTEIYYLEPDLYARVCGKSTRDNEAQQESEVD